jgi:pimeloyl-ACP methyl ester carboxylesterase
VTFSRRFLLAAALAGAACTPAPQTQRPSAPITPTRFAVDVLGPENAEAGRDVILVHGLGSSPRVWDRVIADFSTDFRLHVLTIAGYAGLPAGGNATDPILEGLAAEIAGYVYGLGLKAPALVGHSMGGVAALLTAIREPDAIGKLMVVDALPYFSVLLNPAIMATEAAMRADAARDEMLRMTPEAFEAGQRQALSNLVKGAVDRARALDWALSADRAVMARAMREVMTTDLRLKVASIRAPTTVLYAWDPAAPAPRAAVAGVYAANYALLKRARLEMVEDAYHYLMLDQPERFRGELALFLSR